MQFSSLELGLVEVKTADFIGIEGEPCWGVLILASFDGEATQCREFSCLCEGVFHSQFFLILDWCHKSFLGHTILDWILGLPVHGFLMHCRPLLQF